MRGRVAPRACWLRAIRRYLAVATAGNLVWETAQLPLYTIWRNGSVPVLARAVFHCTAGDVVIAAVALMIGLATVGDAHWPDERSLAVALAVLAIGVGYTVGSEYVNTVLRQSWAYTEQMPTLPWIGTGLAPLAQWVVVPTFALALASGQPIEKDKAPNERMK
jgi:hypothetical protein